MNTGKAWTVYIVLRLTLFVVPVVILLLLNITGWLAAVIAALIALSLSVLLLSKPREVASESIYDWRNRDRTADDIHEDEAIDASLSADGAAGSVGSVGAAEPAAEDRPAARD